MKWWFTGAFAAMAKIHNKSPTQQTIEVSISWFLQVHVVNDPNLRGLTYRNKNRQQAFGCTHLLTIDPNFPRHQSTSFPGILI